MSLTDPHLLRQQVESRTSRMREEGALDDAGEAEIVRYFGERADLLEAELQELTDEYRRRAETAGSEAATAWLAEAAEALGRRDGEAMRQALTQATTHN